MQSCRAEKWLLGKVARDDQIIMKTPVMPSPLDLKEKSSMMGTTVLA
jgi:hypothetical protein